MPRRYGDTVAGERPLEPLSRPPGSTKGRQRVAAQLAVIHTTSGAAIVLLRR